MSDDPFRYQVAAYVLGALDADERAAFEDHLAGCPRCRDDLVELSPLPSLLQRLSPADLSPPQVDLVPAVVGAAGAEARRLQLSRTRWRVLAGGLAVAAAVLVAVLVLDGDDTPPQFGGEPVELTIFDSGSIEGRVAVADQPWGSRVEVNLTAMPARDGYQVWAVGRDGSWQVAASWGPDPSGTCWIIGATSLHPDDIDRIVVTSDDKADELLSAW